jgi:glycosyltransferase involved in cell wall biosynthesis
MGKTAAIYNPYLDTLGGGERYTLMFAKVLAELGFIVDIEWSDKEILSKLNNRFGFKSNANIKIVDSVKRGENYDLIFYVSDGSIPTLRSRNNYLHFQVPFMNVNGKSLLNKMKLYRVNKIICNSIFTKAVIDKEYGVNSQVLYPPIDTDLFRPMRKENNILYVGRFSSLMQYKGQEILIDSFKKLYQKGIKDWKLILAGGVEVGSDKMLSELKKSIEGYPIEIVESPTFEELKILFGKSKIFWSASGYGIDESREPQKVEHFGMTVVESMSAGNVPVVSNIGGHKEIIDNGKNGILWNSQEELIEQTFNLINTKSLIGKFSKECIIASLKFSNREFKKEVLQILK